MTKTEKLRQFIIQNIQSFEYDGATGSSLPPPDFELSPHDYLVFAENALDKLYKASDISSTTALSLNCTSHLRLAMDCQLDIFLHRFNLDRIFNEKCLGVRERLDFLNKSGIVGSRFLARLYVIRDKMESSYATPKLRDVEEYFFLVLSFVSILQHTCLLAGACDHHIVVNDGIGNHLKRFTVEYDFEVPKIMVAWEVQDQQEQFECYVNEQDDFAFCFKVMFLFYQWDEIVNSKYIVSQLNEN